MYKKGTILILNSNTGSYEMEPGLHPIKPSRSVNWAAFFTIILGNLLCRYNNKSPIEKLSYLLTWTSNNCLPKKVWFTLWYKQMITCRYLPLSNIHQTQCLPRSKKFSKNTWANSEQLQFQSSTRRTYKTKRIRINVGSPEVVESNGISSESSGIAPWRLLVSRLGHVEHVLIKSRYQREVTVTKRL